MEYAQRLSGRCTACHNGYSLQGSECVPCKVTGCAKCASDPATCDLCAIETYVVDLQDHPAFLAVLYQALVSARRPGIVFCVLIKIVWTVQMQPMNVLDAEAAII